MPKARPTVERFTLGHHHFRVELSMAVNGERTVLVRTVSCSKSRNGPFQELPDFARQWETAYAPGSPELDELIKRNGERLRTYLAGWVRKRERWRGVGVVEW